MMIRGMLLLLLAQFVTSALLVDVTQIRVNPKHGSVSGVFHATLPGPYKFNASAARDVCHQLGVAIADKMQLERALKSGFETCKFGWIDEQIAVIPRIQSKDSCGQGRVGVIPWRAALSAPFDVYCFNSTDYEARMNTAHESPSTTVPPTARTSGAHTKLAKTTRPASRNDLQSTSSSLPVSVNDEPESQAFSNRSPTTAAGLIALLTTVLVFLLLSVAAVCYFKKVGRWNKSQQKESIETEICGEAGKEAQTEVINQHNMTSNTNETSNGDAVSVTIKSDNENENGEPC